MTLKVGDIVHPVGEPGDRFRVSHVDILNAVDRRGDLFSKVELTRLEPNSLGLFKKYPDVCLDDRHWVRVIVPNRKLPSWW